MKKKKRKWGSIYLQERMEIIEQKKEERKIRPVKNPKYAKMIVTIADYGFDGIRAQELFEKTFGKVNDKYERFYKFSMMYTWIIIFRRQHNIPFYTITKKGIKLLKILENEKEFDQVIELVLKILAEDEKNVR